MIPRHIGFIMDGNGRWATAHGLPRAAGYAHGVEAMIKVLKRASELGVQAVSVYAFSTENFARPEEETAAVLSAVKKWNNSYAGELRVSYSGDIYAFDDEITESIVGIENRTAQNRGMQFNICLNYGGRDDIIHAAKVCYDHGNFSREEFENALSTSHLPPLDLIVRSGGEKRLSGFMLYEAAYSELLFSDKLWPDFDESDVDFAVEEFGRRVRKFGA